MIGQLSLDGGACAERLMLASKVVIHHIERHCDVIFYFLADRVKLNLITAGA